jgi:hypothetical protein
LVSKAHNAGNSATEGLSKEKEKLVTPFELNNYLQNEDTQKILGCDERREQHLNIEKLCIICSIVVRSLNDN